MDSVYHRGEIAVQQMAGELNMAEQTGRSVRDYMPKAASDFLANQTFIIISTIDGNHRVWATLLIGAPGFVEPIDEQNVRIHISPLQQTQLRDHLNSIKEIGILAIEPTTRRRMRLNGTAELHPDGIMVKTEQVYANCPKYIQARDHRRAGLEQTEAAVSRTATTWNDKQIHWIEQADTFFIATASPDHKADASHRGGSPGFIRVIDNKTLVFPDYAGNSMYNTLGNIYTNPHCGMLFIDYETGDTMQLTGKATILPDSDELLSTFPGALRLTQFELELSIEWMNANPNPWPMISYSPFNPKLV
ncbi:pyridoxamine 5'-phosphate oxidase family protein [Paenibacillus sp. FSL K6-0108]|uniref:pyridoxamine 5'-phosphate oxidase family protein n=1 Tax=Paenibacillus sp. FSL K6-0108 TaxID=2921417 RepID=UPI00324731BA